MPLSLHSLILGLSILSSLVQSSDHDHRRPYKGPFPPAAEGEINKPCPGGVIADPPKKSKGIKSGNSTDGGCAVDCVQALGDLDYNFWEEEKVAETLTAETVVTIINKKQSKTRVTTITNSEIDFDKYPLPTATNEAGTRTFVIDEYAPQGTGYVPVTL